jgi:hypothetical protein
MRIMPGKSALSRLICALLAAVFAAAALAQPREKTTPYRVTLSALTAQGYEVKAVTPRDAVVVQKGAAVYLCNLRLAETSPLSYQTDCFPVR